MSGLAAQMRNTIQLLTIGCIAWTAQAAQAAPTHYLLDAQTSGVQFYARSTLHRFSGTTHELRGELMFDPQTQQLAQPTEISIPVARIETGNTQRDRDLRSMFEADRYPEIRFCAVSLVATEPKNDRASRHRYRLEGTLRIRNIEQPVICDVEALISPEGLVVNGETLVTTTSFQLRPPTIIGFIRVAPQVRVVFSAVWKRE